MSVTFAAARDVDTVRQQQQLQKASTAAQEAYERLCGSIFEAHNAQHQTLPLGSAPSAPMVFPMPQGMQLPHGGAIPAPVPATVVPSAAPEAALLRGGYQAPFRPPAPPVRLMSCTSAGSPTSPPPVIGTPGAPPGMASPRMSSPRMSSPRMSSAPGMTCQRISSAGSPASPSSLIGTPGAPPLGMRSPRMSTGCPSSAPSVIGTPGAPPPMMTSPALLSRITSAGSPASSAPILGTLGGPPPRMTSPPLPSRMPSAGSTGALRPSSPRNASPSVVSRMASSAGLSPREVSSPRRPPAPPSKPTAGLLDPAAVDKHKLQVARTLLDDLQSKTAALTQQNQERKKMLAEYARQQKAQHASKVDADLQREAMAVEKRGNTQLQQLQEVMRAQSLALNHQAAGLVHEYRLHQAEESRRSDNNRLVENLSAAGRNPLRDVDSFDTYLGRPGGRPEPPPRKTSGDSSLGSIE